MDSVATIGVDSKNLSVLDQEDVFESKEQDIQGIESQVRNLEIENHELKRKIQGIVLVLN